jgi:hypothetical protein
MVCRVRKTRRSRRNDATERREDLATEQVFTSGRVPGFAGALGAAQVRWCQCDHNRHRARIRRAHTVALPHHAGGSRDRVALCARDNDAILPQRGDRALHPDHWRDCRHGFQPFVGGIGYSLHPDVNVDSQSSRSSPSTLLTSSILAEYILTLSLSILLTWLRSSGARPSSASGRRPA